MTSQPFRICFVCTGNICRSPIGEIVVRSMLADAGLADRVQVDSAGLGDWHVGQHADQRTLRALRTAGYDGSSHRARQLQLGDLQQRDLTLAADNGHLRELRRMDPDADVRLMRSFDPAAVAAGTLEVDDPYYGDEADFDRCLHEVEAACRGLVDWLGQELPTTAG